MVLNFIGKQVEVVQATNTSLIGLQGVVVDETRNALYIQTKDEAKCVMKRGATYTIGNTIVEGYSIMGRVEERMKKVLRGKKHGKKGKKS